MPAPLAVDLLVGRNIRTCRQRLRMSQAELGRRIGVTARQIERYENGARVGAGRLTELAQALDVPMSRLFDHGARRGGIPGSAG